MAATLTLRRKGSPPTPKVAPKVVHNKPPAVLPVAPVRIDSDRFFILWNAQGARPRMRHATVGDANAERARILATTPDAQVFIFECSKVVL